MDRLRKVKNRQQARFLSHLAHTRQLTPELEQDVKRSYSFFESDVRTLAEEGDLLEEDEYKDGGLF